MFVQLRWSFNWNTKGNSHNSAFEWDCCTWMEAKSSFKTTKSCDLIDFPNLLPPNLHNSKWSNSLNHLKSQTPSFHLINHRRQTKMIQMFSTLIKTLIYVFTRRFVSPNWSESIC
jgi:hypothetical protein